MATIRKREASWQVQIRRQGHPLITHSFKLKADAEAWARKIEAEIDRGDLPKDRRILRTTLLSELLIRYRDTVTVHKRGAPQETLRLNQFLARPSSQLPLVKVTGAAIAQYRDERLKTANRTWPVESGKEAKPLMFNGCKCEGLHYTMVARRPPNL
jgi:hypothetical protein